MMDKKYLEQLSLEWSPDADFSDSQSEMNILSKLQPYKNLERLYLSNYRGTKFPKWVGDPSYHNITRLSLSRC
ncbi:putative leucine-rich repeat domain, L domain-containing protein [Medicago truncatula]|uniref:NBS-LRR type disease resistance protein Rps1-k-1, putative n=1 Tax=Medicago truncatula TaxID=3880 RepID=A2Q525_MEDTR|nr:NBS-LRR type disease resistance protein Rps1-k-1, putative [Medicago truncatula]RHN71996.1 putative leucine-rich repeat domain, L domain-containing protein [Medicago truncatula]